MAMEDFGYSIIEDHSEPRQSVYYVMHEGKIVEPFYSKSDALAFVAETTGEVYGEDEG